MLVQKVTRVDGPRYVLACPRVVDTEGTDNSGPRRSYGKLPGNLHIKQLLDEDELHEIKNQCPTFFDTHCESDLGLDVCPAHTETECLDQNNTETECFDHETQMCFDNAQLTQDCAANVVDQCSSASDICFESILNSSPCLGDIP